MRAGLGDPLTSINVIQKTHSILSWMVRVREHATVHLKG